MLSAVGRHPGLTLGSVAALVIVTFASVPFLRTEFLPAFHERQFILHLETAPGTSLDTVLAVGERATRILQQMPQVVSVALHAGHAELSNEHAGMNKAEMDVTLTPEGGEDASLQGRILAAVRGAPGVRWTANTFLVERIHETLSGQTAPVVITVYGSSLTELDGDADGIAKALQKIPGANGVSIAAPPGRPQVSVVLDRTALLQYGLTADQVLGAIRTMYAGDTVGRVYTGGRSFPIVVVLPPALRTDPAAVGAHSAFDSLRRDRPAWRFGAYSGRGWARSDPARGWPARSGCHRECIGQRGIRFRRARATDAIGDRIIARRLLQHWRDRHGIWPSGT